MSQHETLAAAMRAVMLDVGYVQKKTRVQGYTAAGESEVIAAIRPAMLEHGVIGPIPVGGDEPIIRDLDRGGGKNMRYVVIRRTFRFIHADSKESIDVVTYGEGADTLDKASLKAMTSAKKYAIREAFCLETGDDPDRIPSEQQEQAAETFYRAHAAIMEAKTKADLDKYIGLLEQREELSHDDRTRLRKAAESRKAKLK